MESGGGGEDRSTYGRRARRGRGQKGVDAWGWWRGGRWAGIQEEESVKLRGQQYGEMVVGWEESLRREEAWWV